MRRTDAQYRIALLLAKAPALSAHWYIEPFSDDPEDIEVAEFVEWCLHNMHRTFISFLREALYSLDYGHYAFEKCFEPAVWRPTRQGSHPRNVVKWKDFAPRHPLTLLEIDKDTNGRPVGWWHMKNNQRSDRVRLDWEKLLVFTWDEEADDPTGLSAGRSAYLHWYYKQNLYKVDAIQKERHGIGIPEIELPPGFKPSDKTLANEMGKNLRTNEKAHVTKLPGWQVGFVELRGQPVDVLKSAVHHNSQIAVNFMAQFLASTEGSNAKDESHIELFQRAMRYMGDWLRGVINHNAIPELVDFSFKVKGYPQLKVRRLTGSAEARALAVAVRNLAEPGFLTPTGEAEAFVAEVLDFPAPTKQAMNRSIKDRISAEGTRGNKDEPTEPGSGEPGSKDDPGTRPNRKDSGNANSGKSPSGRPTE
jgi:hypothetical protein